MELSRRNFVKGAALAAAGSAGVIAGLVAPSGQLAYADPVGRGSIGLSFGDNRWVLAGESVTGRIYSYDIGGADAFDLTFDYDASAFASVAVAATAGTTVLAKHDNGSQLQVVFMVDPAVADYGNLLAVTVTAATATADGAICLAVAKAAKQGGTIELEIIGGTTTIGVRPFDPISEMTIESLSLAMTFFMVDRSSARWPDAARFDMNGDGQIDLADFMRIANGILDASSNLRLRFRADGSFTILQVSDYQDYINATTRPNVHARTVTLFNTRLDDVKPDLVIMTGDMIGGNMNASLLQEYIRQMMLPCEEHNIPWMITYGNHDEDATTALAAGWDKVRQLDYYRSFPNNVNRPSMSGCVEKTGSNTVCVGDMYLHLYDTEGETPIYNIWAFDSNRYRSAVNRPVPYGSNITGTQYDWIRPQQVDWYYRSSEAIENRYGKLNSLMFYHIPLLEWSNMWLDKDRYGVTGRRAEVECPAFVNSGLWAAAYERGDVRGMFVGHDHDNDYLGNYHGIALSYDASIGYATYGGEYKGGKVITLNKADLSTFTTRMIYASEYGLSQ
jgi:hypothetical protein